MTSLLARLVMSRSALLSMHRWSWLACCMLGMVLSGKATVMWWMVDRSEMRYCAVMWWMRYENISSSACRMPHDWFLNTTGSS